jgi:hypothetical protein
VKWFSARLAAPSLSAGLYHSETARCGTPTGLEKSVEQLGIFAQAFLAQLHDARSPPPIGSPAVSAADQMSLDISLAAAAASSCGVYFQLLRGSSFSRRIGQPLLTVLEKVQLIRAHICAANTAKLHNWAQPPATLLPALQLDPTAMDLWSDILLTAHAPVCRLSSTVRTQRFLWRPLGHGRACCAPPPQPGSCRARRGCWRSRCSMRWSPTAGQRRCRCAVGMSHVVSVHVLHIDTCPMQHTNQFSVRCHSKGYCA